MTEVAYKLVDGREWQAARAAGVYLGSALDLADGYIHMSTAQQLAETAAKHYHGQHDLRLVTVDLTALGETLTWEPSRGGALFPHIYGPLPMTAVLAVRGLSMSEDGLPRFADGTTVWPVSEDVLS